MFAHRTPTWIWSLLIGLCTTLGARGADLHFIVFADTLDTGIGVIEDLANSRDWAEQIADYTGLTLNYQPLSGSSLTVPNAWSHLDGITADTDDVIYFLYTGHGYNPGAAKWPSFWFTSNAAGVNSDITFDGVKAVLEQKNARLLVMLADCCNNYAWQTVEEAPHYLPRQESGLSRDNFRRLFVDFSGTVLSSGAEAGQFSLGGPGAGGVFTNSFMNALDSLAATESVLTWDAVMQKTRSDTQTTAAEYGENQTPQYELVGAAMPDTTGDDSSSDDTWGSDNTGGFIDESTSPACGAVGPVLLMMLPAAWLVRRRNMTPSVPDSL